MRTSTAVILSLLGAAGAGVVAYLLRDKSESLRFLTAGVVFASPWAVHALLAKPSCSFLFITDTHGPAADNAALVRAMLTERDVSFVVHGGDVADNADFFGPWWDTPFAPIIAKWPIYAVPGNHDIDTAAGAMEFTSRFGMLPRSIVCGDAEIFFLPWEPNRFDVEWLENGVRASQKAQRILVTHRPVWTTINTAATTTSQLSLALERISLVLSGHAHVAQESAHGTVAQVIEISGPKKYECPPNATNCVEDSTGYVRVDVFSDHLKIARRVVG